MNVNLNNKSKNNAALSVKQIGSSHGCSKVQKCCLIGLGLRKIGHTVLVENTESVKGMINKVKHLVVVDYKD